AVLAQSLRTLIHSRLEVGLRAYDREFPDADVILFEPRRDDYRMFFTNVFRFSDRRAICEHGHVQTRADLLARHHELAPVLARHGLRLRTGVLGDRPPSRWADRAGEAEGKVAAAPASSTAAPLSDVERLGRALDRLDELTA
ncbi:MAG TPA: patatin family protein, partial [Thermoanaerobaculia bacterium]|nr:patatin family protein [Thermoanaerobaculia bacterium]